MTTRSVVHATFTVERTYAAAPARVFAAFADPVEKLRWFHGPDGWEMTGRSFDFRPGGWERHSAGPKEGPAHKFAALYQDIVPNERIIYSYEMHLDDRRISVSLAVIEFKPAGKGTRLVITESGAFLDGFDGPKSREDGTRWLLENVAAVVEG